MLRLLTGVGSAVGRQRLVEFVERNWGRRLSASPLAVAVEPAVNHEQIYYDLQGAVSSKNLSSLPSAFNEHDVQSDSTVALVVLEQLLHAAGRTGDSRMASELIDCMKVLGLPLHPWAHKSLLHAWSKRGHFAPARTYLATSIPKLDSTHFNAVARYAVPAGAVEVAQEVFALARERRVQPCDTLVGVMLAAEVAQGSSTQVLHAWERQLRERPAAHGLRAYANLVFAICNCAGRAAPSSTVRRHVSWAFGEVLALLQRRPAHDALEADDQRVLLHVLGAVAMLAARAADRALLKRALAVAEEYALLPDEAIYYSIMFLACEEGCHPSVQEANLAEMLGMGLLPGEEHYNQLLRAYAAYGAVDEAAGVLERMEAAGLPLSVSSFHTFITTAAMAGNLPWATWAYNEMRRRQLRVEAGTYGYLFMCARNYGIGVRIHCARTKAQLALDEQQTQMKKVLDSRDARFAAGYLQVAAWQQDMVAAGVQHSEESLQQLLLALDRINKVEDLVNLVKVFEQQRPDDAAAHNVALRAAGRHRAMQHITQALQLADRLRERGQGKLKPRQYHQVLAAYFWLYRDTTKLQEVVSAMARDGHPLDASAAKHLLAIYCCANEWGSALHILDNHLLGAQPAGDDVWHMACRHLWAADRSVVAQFLSRMDAQQRHRFSASYPFLATEQHAKHVIDIAGAEQEVTKSGSASSPSRK